MIHGCRRATGPERVSFVPARLPVCHAPNAKPTVADDGDGCGWPCGSPAFDFRSAAAPPAFAIADRVCGSSARFAVAGGAGADLADAGRRSGGSFAVVPDHTAAASFGVRHLAAGA